MPKITMQEMFNKVWERAKIPVRSYFNEEKTLCGYRNKDGSDNHCFIGICIPDEEYTIDIEGTTARDNCIQKLIPGISVNFMSDLQNCHDEIDPKDWRSELERIGLRWYLTIPE